MVKRVVELSHFQREKMLKRCESSNATRSHWHDVILREESESKIETGHCCSGCYVTYDCATIIILVGKTTANANHTS